MDVKPAVISKKTEETVNGISTQVVCSAFSDRILVVVTQYGKMGTLVSLTPNMVSGELGKPSLSTKVLLGQDEPLIHVFAKNLATFVSEESKNKPILLAVALRDKSVDSIKTLKDMIKHCQVW